MEQYLDINLDSDNVMKSMHGIADRVLSRFKKDMPVKKGPGGLNEITDLRAKIALMIEKPFYHVCGITNGWTVHELFVTYEACRKFVNPGALFWTIYKKKKHIYGKQTNAGMGNKGRQSNSAQVRQASLF